MTEKTAAHLGDRQAVKRQVLAEIEQRGRLPILWPGPR